MRRAAFAAAESADDRFVRAGIRAPRLAAPWALAHVGFAS
jgi:hypothetical protein